MHNLHAPVAALMRDVAARIVMPRFRQLDAADIHEKEPGDLVTIADRESEAALAAALPGILPGSRVIGEEAVAADPGLVDGIGAGAAWIVDPIDGTGNYAAGTSPFAIMIALAIDGATQAGWILDPVSGRLCHAFAGGGAFIDGEGVRATGSGAAAPIAGITTVSLPPDMRDEIDRRAGTALRVVAIPRCAGEQYPRLVTGVNDIALFWRAHPWDHAPGALFLTEAGGRLARFDGTPYRIDQTGPGLLAAATPALWDEAHRILLG